MINPSTTDHRTVVRDIRLNSRGARHGRDAVYRTSRAASDVKEPVESGLQSSMPCYWDIVWKSTVTDCWIAIHSKPMLPKHEVVVGVETICSAMGIWA